MVFTVSFYLALSICFFGVFLRMAGWARTEFDPQDSVGSLVRRLSGIFTGSLRILSSRRIVWIAAALIRDVFLQIPLLRAGFFRWLAHMCIFYGFVLLVMMHALGSIITAFFFPDYASTLDPFMMLRNLFGAMVLFGILVAALGRMRRNRFFRATSRSDRLVMFLLALVIVSGFLLESVQIVSAPIFDQMVDDYMGTDDTEIRDPLKAYWAKEFYVVFSEQPSSQDLETGQTLHEENCAACHSRPGSAFLSFSLSRLVGPWALWLNRVRADIWLWYIHFGICFVALALLPFTKFFHLISVPLNLMARAGVGLSSHPGTPDDITRLALEMDACTHCGVCSLHCSVAPIFRIIPNTNILPSEKLMSVTQLAHGKQLDATHLEAVSEGSFICTECFRCTERCPSGISLQTLWRKGKQTLIDRDYPDPHGWVRQLTTDQWADRLDRCRDNKPLCDTFNRYRHAAQDPNTFSACIQCSICTNVCPVVAAADGMMPPEVTPQQVMNLLRLNLKELALGSRMVWDCVTCYLCQEHCPQGIRVTDILYDLRNIAVERLQPVRRPSSRVHPDGCKTDDPHGKNRNEVS